jgi:hypothetical protein
MSQIESPPLCPVCIERQANLGDPSHARWIGPDGIEYCSLHFIAAFGHGEPLVKIPDYVPPEGRKAPAPRQPAAAKKDEETKKDEVEA